MANIQSYEKYTKAILKELKRVEIGLESHDRKCSTRPGGHDDAAIEQLEEVLQRLEKINGEILS